MDDRRQKDVFISENTDDKDNPVFELNLCRPMPAKLIKDLLSHDGLVLTKAVFRFTAVKPKNNIKEAMLAKNTVLLETLRSMVAAFTNELVSKNKKPDEMLTDEDVLAVITRLSKQRKDSIEQFEKAGRQDLADKEKKELEMLQTYLPKQMSGEEIKTVVKQTINETGAKSMADIGKVMSAAMSKLKGKADGSLVSKIVKELLSSL